MHIGGGGELEVCFAVLGLRASDGALRLPFERMAGGGVCIGNRLRRRMPQRTTRRTAGTNFIQDQRSKCDAGPVSTNVFDLGPSCDSNVMRNILKTGCVLVYFTASLGIWLLVPARAKGYPCH